MANKDQGSSESKSWPCTRKPHESPHVPESTVHTKGWLIPPSPEAWYCSNSNNLSMKRMSPQWSSLGTWINLIVAQEIKKTCMNDVCFFKKKESFISSWPVGILLSLKILSNMEENKQNSFSNAKLFWYQNYKAQIRIYPMEKKGTGKTSSL